MFYVLNINFRMFIHVLLNNTYQIIGDSGNLKGGNFVPSGRFTFYDHLGLVGVFLVTFS